MNEYLITSEEKGERLDTYLSRKMPEYSRTFLAKLIKMGEVTVNGEGVKAGYILKEKDKIKAHILVQKDEDIAAEPIDLDIIYEDENVIVINKQPGLVVHPASSYKSGTLVNALIYHFPNIKEAVFEKGNEVSESRPGLVHRLDKDTSGAMIIAKNPRAIHSLSRQIQNRTIKKIYWALCSGWPANEEGVIENYIGRSTNDRKIFSIVPAERGKIAISEYCVKKLYTTKSNRKVSLVEFNIKTGRTHQIRVHAKSIGIPILGDATYFTKESQSASKELGVRRQMLHAKEMQITLPGDTKLKLFSAPLQPDFEEIIEKLST